MTVPSSAMTLKRTREEEGENEKKEDEVGKKKDENKMETRRKGRKNVIDATESKEGHG